MDGALLLIDIQNDYFPGGAMELVAPLPALANAKLLLDRFRAEKLPVVHVQHLSTRGGSTFFLPGTPGAEIHPELRPLDDEALVIKHAPNSFFETNLDDLLRRQGIGNLTVVGMMTHMCVDSTVRSAWERGFVVTLAGDACATRDLVHAGRSVAAHDVHAAYLAGLNGLFAKVMDAPLIA